MNRSKKVLLLIGSAKRPRSTSESLGTYLLEQLGERGFTAETVFLYRALASGQAEEVLLDAAAPAGLIVFAFPLYVDCLPALVIRAMERFYARRPSGGEPRGQQVLAIVNCGFPEAHHCDTALAICRQFAREAGFEWAGGLALGGGEALGARALREVGGMARNVIRALDLSANAIAEGDRVPQKAVSLMARPLMPSWFYTWVGNRFWRQRARKHGMEKELGRRPFEV